MPPYYYVPLSMYHAPVFFHPTIRWPYFTNQITPAPAPVYVPDQPGVLRVLSPYSNKYHFMERKAAPPLIPPSPDTSVHHINYPHDFKKPAVDVSTGKGSKTTGDGTQDKT